MRLCVPVCVCVCLRAGRPQRRPAGAARRLLPQGWRQPAQAGEGGHRCGAPAAVRNQAGRPLRWPAGAARRPLPHVPGPAQVDVHDGCCGRLHGLRRLESLQWDGYSSWCRSRCTSSTRPGVRGPHAQSMGRPTPVRVARATAQYSHSDGACRVPEQAPHVQLAGSARFEYCLFRCQAGSARL